MKRLIAMLMTVVAMTSAVGCTSVIDSIKAHDKIEETTEQVMVVNPEFQERHRIDGTSDITYYDTRTGRNVNVLIQNDIVNLDFSKATNEDIKKYLTFAVHYMNNYRANAFVNASYVYRPIYKVKSKGQETTRELDENKFINKNISMTIKSNRALDYKEYSDQMSIEESILEKDGKQLSNTLASIKTDLHEMFEIDRVNTDRKIFENKGYEWKDNPNYGKEENDTNKNPYLVYVREKQQPKFIKETKWELVDKSNTKYDFNLGLNIADLISDNIEYSVVDNDNTYAVIGADIEDKRLNHSLLDMCFTGTELENRLSEEFKVHMTIAISKSNAAIASISISLVNEDKLKTKDVEPSELTNRYTVRDFSYTANFGAYNKTQVMVPQEIIGYDYGEEDETNEEV